MTTLAALGEARRSARASPGGHEPGRPCARRRTRRGSSSSGGGAGAPSMSCFPIGGARAERGLATLPPPAAGRPLLRHRGRPLRLRRRARLPLRRQLGRRREPSTPSGRSTREARSRSAGEKRAFEALHRLRHGSARRRPDLHVYHYAPYEPTALKRLMGRHATREDEVDRLLRGGVFVDLLRAVRQGVRASVESYSIKRIEPLLRLHARDRPARRRLQHRRVRGVAAARRGRRPPRTSWSASSTTTATTCVSNARLRDWLEGQRGRAGSQVGRRGAPPGIALAGRSEGLTEAGARVQALTDRLTAGVPADPARADRGTAASWLLAQLLSWHRREDEVARGGASSA